MGFSLVEPSCLGLLFGILFDSVISQITARQRAEWKMNSLEKFVLKFL